MYLHTIIIPHRNRAAELEACVTSIYESAVEHFNRLVGDALEIIVVDTQSLDPPSSLGFVKVIHDEDPLQFVELRNGKKIQMYNRFRALNLGIEAAKGELLTFLDCDSIVGPDFLAAWDKHLTPGHPPTKLCYRVRYLPREKFNEDHPTAVLAHLKEHETFPMAREAYGTAEITGYGEPGKKTYPGPNCVNMGMNPLIFGNSQFSIPRKTLGSLRYNEDFVGMGWGDIWMNREIERRHRPGYRAIMVTDPGYAIMQISTLRHEPDWFNSEVLEWNKQRYYDS